MLKSPKMQRQNRHPEVVSGSPAVVNRKFPALISVMICLLLMSALSSCWYYSFSGSSLVGVETVYIPVFGNNTAEFGLEDQLTDAMINAINAERNLNTGERGNTDAVLEGRILRIDDVPLTYTAGETVTEYKVEITVHVKFEDVNNEKIIMEGDFTAFGEYPYPGTQDDRDQAAVQAISKLSQDILAKAVSGW